MCGIAGVVAFDSRFAVAGEAVERMGQRLAHRGPDGHGVWFAPATGADAPFVGLAHRRLAVIDPDPRAAQPMVDDHGNALVFNGEIYNYRDLRRQLERDDIHLRWRTKSDTEVLLHGLAKHSAAFVPQLRGMFAFAFWNAGEQRLTIARDRMGQKPLFLAHAPDGGGVAFASEPSALLHVPWVNDEVTPETVAAYLRWGYVPRGSIYAGIAQLPPGSLLIYTRRGVEQRAYERDAEAETDVRSAETPTEVRGIIESAVAEQLVADVPLGCFLSGGVDSSIIAACMRRALGPRAMSTFSISFADPQYDESEYARQIAEHLHTKHHRFVVEPDAANDLPMLAEHLAEPMGDSSLLPTHYLSRETREHVTVALSGDGGDELFAGYDRYRAMAMTQRLPNWLRRVLESRLWQALPGAHPKGKLTRLKRWLATLDQPAGPRFASYHRYFTDRHLSELWADDTPPPGELWPVGDPPPSGDWIIDCFSEAAQREADHADDVALAMAADRACYLPEDVLAKVDRASMLHALEVRSPMMDHRVVRTAATIAPSAHMKAGPKSVLREAFAETLPDWVFTRRKMGFAVPIGQWLRSELRPMLHDHVFAADSLSSVYLKLEPLRKLINAHQRQQADHSQRLYALLMLELWHRADRRRKDILTSIAQV